MKTSIFKILSVIMLCIFLLVSCEENTNNNQPTQEVTLLDKIWITSNGTESFRFRFSTDGIYIQGDNSGFTDQGTWTWEDEEEQIIKAEYPENTLWYRFEELTSNSVTGFISDSIPYEWGEPILFSLSSVFGG